MQLGQHLGSKGSSASSRSTCGRMALARPGLQAQTVGATQCTMGISGASALTFLATRSEKSGTSTVSSRSGFAATTAATASPMRVRTVGRRLTTAITPMSWMSDWAKIDLSPWAASKGPPTPTTSTCRGASRPRKAAMKLAARLSPEASPATTNRRKGRSASGLASTGSIMRPR